MNEHISPHWRTVIERLRAAADNCGSAGLPNGEDGCAEREGFTRAYLLQAFNALVRQTAASVREQNVLPYENADPLGASLYTVCGGAQNRIIHQYKSRCLFLTTGHCYARCRYCFRRGSSALDYAFASKTHIGSLCAYIQEHGEIRELLLSGGDPLTASDMQLETLLSAVRASRPDIIIRVCTRAPVFAPERFDEALIALLKRYKPLWLIPHINHAAEFSPHFAPEAHSALCALAESGIPMQSQTVLLRGINDSVAILTDLFYKLAGVGIRPGYLFQGDLAPGTSHFRVPIDEGLRLYERLCAELSGLTLPVYAADLPGGGGKFNLLRLDSALTKIRVRRSEKSYIFTDGDRQYEYPLEK